MVFRLVSGGGNVVDPAFINIPASGTVRPGMVVDLDRANGRVAPASSSSTVTTIFGVSLDYAEGVSDTFVKVIPFLSSQLWDADAVNAVSTAQIGRKQQLYGSNSVLINNNTYDQSGVTGVFLCTNIVNVASGSARILGQFIRLPSVPQNTGLYF